MNKNEFRTLKMDSKVITNGEETYVTTVITGDYTFPMTDSHLIPQRVHFKNGYSLDIDSEYLHLVDLVYPATQDTQS